MSSAYPKIRMLINGLWRDGSGSEPVINPADETVIGRVPMASHADLEDALQAAEAGLEVWRSTSPRERCRVLLTAARLLRERAEKLAMILVLEQGKTFAQALGEVQRGCEIIEWDANEARRMYGRVIPSEPQMRQLVLRQPIGVVAAFSPWNFPFSSPARKVAASIAAGCALILKPAEETPGGAMLLAEALMDAGLPPGVFNLVFGRPAEISEYLIAQPSVRLVTFTGSVPVGKELASFAGRYMKPSLMELGGHGPVIICRDTDPVRAAAAAVAAKSVNAGQACVSPTRFFVEAPLFERFASEFAELASRMVIGSGLDKAAQMGPVTNRRRLMAISDLVEDARGRGARVLCGGKRIGTSGFFYPLTLLADVPADARAMHEEPFGPLAILNPVANVDEAIAQANALPFGLSAYAFTDSSRNVGQLSERIEAGTLSINHFAPSFAETPFGGVKDSGFGREGGIESLESYTVVKSVSHLMYP